MSTRLPIVFVRWLCFGIIVGLILLKAQSAFSQHAIEERLLEAQAEGSEQSELAELLNERRLKPLDLNLATAAQLSEFPTLDLQLARAIIDFRKRRGMFDSKEALLAVPGMDAEIFMSLAEFVTTTTIPGRRNALSELQFRSRISDKVTLDSTSEKIYNRLRFTLFESVEGGLLFEKDGDESRFDDLRLFYIQSRFKKNWVAIAGNFQFQAGQGLVFWGPYGFAKGAAATYPVRKKGKGLRRYMSVDENASLFGAGIEFRGHNGGVTLFASRNALDATPVSDKEVSVLSVTGLHRSESELARKDAVREGLLGARLTWSPLPALQIGATTFLSSYNKRITNPDMARKRYDFRGNKNFVFGFDWTFEKQGAEFFGEVARSRNGGLAVVAGTRLKTTPVRLAFLVRNYSKDFQNAHSFGFGERNGDTQNEIGYYAGLEYKISGKASLSAYYDIFSFPWRSFFEPLPLSGNDFFVQLEHNLNRNFYLTLRFRDKAKQSYEIIPGVSVQPNAPLTVKHRQQVRLQVDMRVSKQVTLRSRVEHTRIHYSGFPKVPVDSDETGFLLYQDLRVEPFPQLRITTRLSLFGTGSFESSVYQFEHDLPGMLTNRALFGHGSRWYLLLRYKVGDFGVVHVKYSSTFIDGATSTLQGTKIGVQIDIGI